MSQLHRIFQRNWYRTIPGFTFARTVRKAHIGKTGFLPSIWEYKSKKGQKVYVRAFGVLDARCQICRGRESKYIMVPFVVQNLRDGSNGWPALVAEFTAGQVTYVMIPKTKDLKGPWSFA